MSTSETSSEAVSSEGIFDDGSSTWWDIGATISVLAAVAPSSTTGFTDQDASLPFQELTGRQWVALKLLNREECYTNFHLYPAGFHKLHTILVNNHGLTSTTQYESIEALGMFLWACGTRQCKRQMAGRFRRSLDTVSRKFSEVLEAMVSFAQTIIKPKDPTFSYVHPKVHHLTPYFDGCIGAIDGTHIRVTIPDTVHYAFINRKGFTSQNVMAVCDHDGIFTFVAAGKRGAAHDAAVFREAVKSNHFPHPPPGKFYVVDSGYKLEEGYVAPYRKTRYHQKEFEQKGPEDTQELFNFHHSRVRNVIERSFGILKNRWQIMQGVPLYSMDRQTKIIVACFALHNFAMGENEPELHTMDSPILPSQEWLLATTGDEIKSLRDWMALGLLEYIPE